MLSYTCNMILSEITNSLKVCPMIAKINLWSNLMHNYNYLPEEDLQFCQFEVSWPLLQPELWPGQVEDCCHQRRSWLSWTSGHSPDWRLLELWRTGDQPDWLVCHCWACSHWTPRCTWSHNINRLLSNLRIKSENTNTIHERFSSVGFLLWHTQF